MSSDGEISGAGSPDPDGRRENLRWELPEIFAVAVVVSVGLLALGGLATGIARLWQQIEGPVSAAWYAVQFGAEWAGFLLVGLVLGALTLCWWQGESWGTVMGDAEEADWSLSEARGHLRRTRVIVRWCVGALGVIALGAVAGFAGDIGGALPGAWPLQLLQGTQTLVALVLVGAGLFVGLRLDREASALLAS